MATDVTRFNEIRDEMFQLLQEADGILRAGGTPGTGAARERAQAYWIPQMKAALGDHNYSNMCSMEDTANELEELVYNDESDEDDE